MFSTLFDMGIYHSFAWMFSKLSAADLLYGHNDSDSNISRITVSAGLFVWSSVFDIGETTYIINTLLS